MLQATPNRNLRRLRPRLCRFACILTLAAATAPGSVSGAKVNASAQDATGNAVESQYSDVLAYIASAWSTLGRSTTACDSLVDPKVEQRPVLYLPAGFPEPAAVAGVQSKCNVDVERLPAAIHHVGDVDGARLKPGLLYLPHPYVVPGGMFNEMYGWDSYFIIRGLLRDGLRRW